MYAAGLVAMVILGYLSGSVNYAVIVTRLRTGRDIRTLGNRNPGTANVARSVGKGWAALVLLLDICKSLGPMLLARLVVFVGDDAASLLAVFAVGIAAVVGHCRPVYYRFRGGGGMAASLSVYFFFVPVEYFASMLLAALLVLVFLRRAEFSVGRWIPILFTTIVPFLTLGLNWVLDVPLYGHLSIGGHPASILVGTLVTSLTILALNVPTLVSSVRKLRRRD